MSEQDVFETRFAAAYRAYLDGAPSAVDAAAVARTAAAAHPRAPIRARVWALRPARAFAWLVLLALLLTAIGLAAILVGSQAERRHEAVLPPMGPTFACPPGSTPDEPGPADQARPEGDSATVLDRGAGRLVTLTATATRTETWTFDVCTNTWTQMHPNREPSGFDGVQLVYDIDSDVTVGLVGGMVWAYDLAADTWTEKGAAPIDATLRAYDPVSGLIVATRADDPSFARPVELWSYDVATDMWVPIRQASPAPAADRSVALAFDAFVDRLIAYAVNGSTHETWLLDLRTGTWAQAGSDTPTIHILWGMAPFPPAIAYDEAAKRTVVLGMGRMAAYDATADRWEVLTGGIDPESGPLRFGPSSQWGLDVYDPVNERLVSGGQAGSLWAFEPATRRWTVLLEASAAGTASTDDEWGPVVSPHPGLAPELEAMLPSDVNGVTFTKTSVVGGVPSSRLGKGGWGTVPFGSDWLATFLGGYGKTLADLDVAIATPTDPSKADTFSVAFQVKGADAIALARNMADYYGVGVNQQATATIGDKQVQVFREVGGMGFDLYVQDDVVFFVFTDGTPLIDGFVAALP